jgi:hypothetical protein
MTKHIVGLCGGKGSGKSSVADYLNKKYDFRKIAFAEPLKNIAKIFGFTDKQLYGTQDDKKEVNQQLGICAREFLQKFGTDICRNTFKDVFPDMKLGSSGSIWVKLTENFIDNNDGNICCEDIRFPDELETISSYPNSIIINIVREHKENIDEFSSHSSETSLSDVSMKSDITIFNDGSLQDLYDKIDELLLQIHIR